MKKILISVVLMSFLAGGVVSNVQAEEHTKQYQEWRDMATKGLQLSTRCLETKKGIKLLANNIKNKYGNSPESLESISGHIKWTHKAFIILERDTGAKGLSQTKTLDVLGFTASSDEPAQWLAGELFKAMEPMDDLAYISGKTPKEIEIISSAKLNNLRFLHVIVEELKNGGDFRKAIDVVDVFEGKLENK